MNKLKITVNNITKEVSVKESPVQEGLLMGTVGEAYFTWDTIDYDMPHVMFKKSIAKDSKVSFYDAVKYVKSYVNEYLFVMKGRSQFAFNECTKKDDIVAFANKEKDYIDHVSGVPLWMKINHKVWTECHKKDGSSYFRRTRFNKDSLSLIEKYLPECSKCPLRATCSKPCSDPSSMNSLNVK